MSEEYGEKFEGMTIVAMAGIIIICLLGAVGLQYAAARDCTENHYTFCGTENGWHGYTPH